jgi:hypothetical protein
VCEGRLTSLKRRLTSKGILREYDTIFTEKNGIIERVPSHLIAGEVGAWGSLSPALTGRA